MMGCGRILGHTPSRPALPPPMLSTLPMPPLPSACPHLYRRLTTFVARLRTTGPCNKSVVIIYFYHQFTIVISPVALKPVAKTGLEPAVKINLQ